MNFTKEKIEFLNIIIKHYNDKFDSVFEEIASNKTLEFGELITIALSIHSYLIANLHQLIQLIETKEPEKAKEIRHCFAKLLNGDLTSPIIKIVKNGEVVDETKH